jgi:hypothetical protein
MIPIFLRALLLCALLAFSPVAGALAAPVVDPTVSGLNSPGDGYFSFGAQCNGTDCPAAEYHIVFNGTTLPNVSGICMRAMAGVYLMDGYGVWQRWSPGSGRFVTSSAPPGGRCNTLPYSAEGSTSTPGKGSLVTAAGTWSLGAACSGSYATLLNGTQTGNGCGNELLISQDGIVFTKDAGNNWWQWSSASGGTWTNLNTQKQP